ncbi:SIMPL domain-containing protein [Bermanella sp. WJH001]|uniref:SIMPL domain-containing protein n=1 Tax=Bermanella sp. WJH001 TaxID=3048005 RepID=UPI0024BE7A43|nr:SIMPL domain-containing protein [Bermanella sp. WJH001]MDJ1539309.1 SIMPL domain-containing protein [Bermanella sp. WJH001]
MLKKIGSVGLLAVLFGLAGCLATGEAQILTQGQGEVALKADQYSIQLGFSEQALSSAAALAKLNGSLAGFIKWKNASGFNVSTQNESVQPIYQYPKNQPRQITGYQAQHSYIVKGLNLQQYDNTMKTLAAFKPESLYQGEVGVSESIRKQAEQQAYDLAYQANRERMKTLTALAKLCWPKVKEIKEYSNSHGGPRVMMMEAKSAPVANEHTISVRLEMIWQASEC